MKNLIDNGCKVYEITDRLLHMKTYMVDGKYFTVGKIEITNHKYF
jgi:phosphatidylserine/phosphatidylglycerophosphate/cardiolipin synthase-like enzyme